MTTSTGERAGDSELTTRFRQDPQQFTEVHDRYFRSVYLYVAGRLDAQTAEDIAAETFLVAFDHRDRFDPGRGGLRPWLFGIATNLVARHRRKEIRHYCALARVEVESSSDSHESRVVGSVAAQQMGPAGGKGAHRAVPRRAATSVTTAYNSGAGRPERFEAWLTAALQQQLLGQRTLPGVDRGA